MFHPLLCLVFIETPPPASLFPKFVLRILAALEQASVFLCASAPLREIVFPSQRVQTRLRTLATKTSLISGPVENRNVRLAWSEVNSGKAKLGTMGHVAVNEYGRVRSHFNFDRFHKVDATERVPPCRETTAMQRFGGSCFVATAHNAATRRMAAGCDNGIDTPGLFRYLARLLQNHG
jgi:hypothetical protein